LACLETRTQPLGEHELGNLAAYVVELDDGWKIALLHKISHLAEVTRGLSRSPAPNRVFHEVLRKAAGCGRPPGSAPVKRRA